MKRPIQENYLNYTGYSDGGQEQKYIEKLEEYIDYLETNGLIMFKLILVTERRDLIDPILFNAKSITVVNNEKLEQYILDGIKDVDFILFDKNSKIHELRPTILRYLATCLLS